MKPSSATLTLSPTELFFLPVGTPATAPATRFEIVCESGEKISLLVRCVELTSEPAGPAGKPHPTALFFRDEAQMEEDIFFKRLYRKSGVTELAGLELTESQLERYYKARFNLRLYYCPQHNFGWVLTSRTTAVFIEKPHVGTRSPNNFYWGSDPYTTELPRLNQRDFREFCEQIWRSPDSHFNQMRHFETLSEEQKYELACGVKVGNWQTMGRMFECVLILTAHQFGWRPYRGRMTLPMCDKVRRFWWEPYFFTHRWRLALLDIFSPVYRHDVPVHINRIRLKQSPGHWVEIHEAPTHHEYLEAAAKLREFLTPYLSPAEIENLFRTDNL